MIEILIILLVVKLLLLAASSSLLAVFLVFFLRRGGFAIIIILLSGTYPALLLNSGMVFLTSFFLTGVGMKLINKFLQRKRLFFSRRLKRRFLLLIYDLFVKIMPPPKDDIFWTKISEEHRIFLSIFPWDEIRKVFFIKENFERVFLTDNVQYIINTRKSLMEAAQDEKKKDLDVKTLANLWKQTQGLQIDQHEIHNPNKLRGFNLFDIFIYLKNKYFLPERKDESLVLEEIDKIEEQENIIQEEPQEIEIITTPQKEQENIIQEEPQEIEIITTPQKEESKENNCQMYVTQKEEEQEKTIKELQLLLEHCQQKNCRKRKWFRRRYNKIITQINQECKKSCDEEGELSSSI